MPLPPIPANADDRFVQGRFSLEELRGKVLHWLLDLELGGQTIRLSGQEVDVTLTDGAGKAQTWHYYGGLDFGEEVGDPISLLSSEAEAKSADLSLYLAPQWSISALVFGGVVLGSATGILRLWPEGATRAITVIVGIFRDPSWDTDEDALVGTLEEDPANDRTLWPDPLAVVTKGAILSGYGATWGSPANKAIGEYYPVIFGSPGRTDPEQVVGSPALCVYDGTGAAAEVWFMVAGHAVIATSVRIVNTSQDAHQVMPVTNEQDGLGRVVALAKWPTPLPLGWTVEDDFWASWEVPTVPPIDMYGMYADDQSDPQGRRGAGDILTYWLRESGIRWDEGRIASAAQTLNSYRIDTYTMAGAEKRIAPWDWVSQNLLPVLPVSARVGPGGVHVVIWRYGATSDMAVARLVASEGGGGNASQAGAVESSAIDDVASTMIVRYGVDADTSEPSATLVLSGDDETIQAGATPDLHLIQGRGIYQRDLVEDVTLEIVRDEGTAGAVAAWMSRAKAVQYYSTSYEVDVETAGSLEPGDVALLTDDLRGFKNRVCLVESVLWSSEPIWQVSLRIPAHNMGEAG